MKDTTKQYDTVIRGHEYTFTAHSTKAGARATINESLNPCLVEVFVDGKGPVSNGLGLPRTS